MEWVSHRPSGAESWSYVHSETLCLPSGAVGPPVLRVIIGAVGVIATVFVTVFITLFSPLFLPFGLLIEHFT